MPGEVAEYRTELRDNKLEVRKEAVKKVGWTDGREGVLNEFMYR